MVDHVRDSLERGALEYPRFCNVDYHVMHHPLCPSRVENVRSFTRLPVHMQENIDRIYGAKPTQATTSEGVKAFAKWA